MATRIRTVRLSWPVAILSCGMVAASYVPSTWSQTGAGSTTLPALPNQQLPTGNAPYANAPSGGMNTIGMAQIAVIGQSNVAGSQSHLMASATLSNGMQQVVLVDPSRLTMVVYHVDPNRGDIQLKSVRKLYADFSLEEFNLTEPTPSTVRKNLRAGTNR